jgi:hypothetical protein
VQVVKEAKRAAEQLKKKQATLARKRPEGQISSKESRELHDQMTKYAAENVLAAENILAAENLLAAALKAKEAVKAAAAAADPKKAKQKQQQAICSQRCYRKSKGRENWTPADIAADAADAENLLAAEEKAAAAAAADPKKAKRKQQQEIRNQRCYKKSKGRKNSTETTQSVFMV